MASKEKVKEKYGLSYSAFFPIKEEPENAHPSYDAAIDLGAAVKAYLTINYAESKAYGDDSLQLDLKEFAGGQLDAETLLNELEVEAALFGSKMEGDALTDSKDDRCKTGGYAYIQKLATKTGTVHRACFIYKVTPKMTSDNADTKAEGFTFAHNAISYSVAADNTGAWRVRKDCDTEADAKAFIAQTAGQTA